MQGTVTGSTSTQWFIASSFQASVVSLELALTSIVFSEYNSVSFLHHVWLSAILYGGRDGLESTGFLPCIHITRGYSGPIKE